MMNNNEKEKKSPRGVQSIDVGGEILRAFVKADKPLQLKNISTETGIATGKLHPYLVSFCNMKLLEKTDPGCYQLGPFALNLGLVRLKNQNAYQEAVKRVAGLSEELDMAVSIAVWGVSGPTVIHLEQLLERAHFNISVGGVYYLTMTASGFVFRAFSPESITNPLVKKEFSDRERSRREFFQIDRSTYDEKIQQTKDDGYASTIDMPVPGITAIAAPIFDHTSKICMSITAFGPNYLIDLEQNEYIISKVTDFALKLSQDLGYSDSTLSR